MIHELSFVFDELTIDYEMIARELGYPLSDMPEPFPQYLEEARQFALAVPDIAGSFCLIDPVHFSADKRSLKLEGMEFRVGKTIASELANSESIGLFICTAGKTISEESERMLKSDDPVYGYVLNVLGSAIAESVGDRVQDLIRIEAGNNGLKITNRYSPGYCHWDVADQHKLFSLFHGKTAGVRLTGSALMHPVKSISGVIGIGEQVQFHDYQCNLCQLEHCFYRGMHYQ
ncbi:vitamin B12 dependent-methionine synthase activation domain-containing protein [Mangrovibacterium sp.]|uniref:vitamin B12 dependent-methionine synthase activation domain-containing protein n=1 Tax=Mangrovibacterium sp. TaxID=1961364 RepID=UPI003562804F